LAVFWGLETEDLRGVSNFIKILIYPIDCINCTGIDYSNLDYGSNLHFATVGSDNGHDGSSSDGRPLLNHPEVINDFSFRAVHVEAVLGKEIVNAYYGKPHSKSYYLGCSTGGRQAMQSALKFPDDFDGILGGSLLLTLTTLTGLKPCLDGLWVHQIRPLLLSLFQLHYGLLYPRKF